MNVESLTAVVIADVALITVASSLFGAVARRCGQPTVIGHIVAGVALGPTLLGRLPGNPTEHLFPADVRSILSILSQLAVVIFMFVAGYEIDLGRLRRGGRSAVLVAVFALAVPMGLSAGAATVFHGVFTAVDPQHADGHSFVLFMAVATSITALPVMAAIIRERGGAGLPASTLALSAAGFMDVAAWLVLAVALVGTGSAPRWSWPVTLVLIVVFAAAMLFVVRPALAWCLSRRRALLANQVPIALALALGSAWVTASLGLHPVFGGFLAGLVMPRRDGAPDPDVLRPMEQGAALLLPLFFVTTGLSFNIGAVDGHAFLLLGLVVLIAVVGKLVPAYGAARLSGLDPRRSGIVAALVNTRGLTELIALNVGLTAGIISGELFTVLVLMALITTFMTGPLLGALGREENLPPQRTADRVRSETTK